MDKNIKDEEEKNVTKYGEFISSYFAWLNLDKQKTIFFLLLLDF